MEGREQACMQLVGNYQREKMETAQLGFEEKRDLMSLGVRSEK